MYIARQENCWYFSAVSNLIEPIPCGLCPLADQLQKCLQHGHAKCAYSANQLWDCRFTIRLAMRGSLSASASWRSGFRPVSRHCGTVLGSGYRCQLVDNDNYRDWKREDSLACTHQHSAL